MELRLCSGVTVSIQENGSFKLLFFDRPVKAMELSKTESAQLGTLLLKGDGYSGVTAALRGLVQSGFFGNSKTFAQIRMELSSTGINAASTSLNRILTKLVEQGELSRSGNRGSYSYGSKVEPKGENL